MQKGQIFSLDFLISLVAVMAAIGLMIQAIEVNAYYQKEERQFNELKTVAETAGDMLVGNPEIVCELVDGSDDYLAPLNNCLTKVDFTMIPPGQWPPRPGNRGWWNAPGRQKNAKFLEKERLGIPSDYSCLVSVAGGGMGVNDRFIVFDCLGDPATAKNVYSASREVVVYDETDDSTVPKSELGSCMSGGACNLNPGTVMIQVWKA